MNLFNTIWINVFKFLNFSSFLCEISCDFVMVRIAIKFTSMTSVQMTMALTWGRFSSDLIIVTRSLDIVVK